MDNGTSNKVTKNRACLMEKDHCTKLYTIDKQWYYVLTQYSQKKD